MVTLPLHHLDCPSANPSRRVDPTRQEALARLKRAVVRLGMTSGRQGFKLAEIVFQILPELKAA